MANPSSVSQNPSINLVLAIDPPQLAHKHWLRILHRWPVDLVRPKTVSFQEVMRQRLDNLSNPSTSASPPTTANIKANEPLVSVPEPKKWDEKKEMEQVDVLYSFLEDQYSKAYPLPPALRNPASSPTYYDDLMRELEEAPGRSWFGSLVKKWKGFLRFS